MHDADDLREVTCLSIHITLLQLDELCRWLSEHRHHSCMSANHGQTRRLVSARKTSRSLPIYETIITSFGIAGRSISFIW